MKNWTDTLTLAAVAATLTLTACLDEPASIAPDVAGDSIEVNGEKLSLAEYELHYVWPARIAAMSAAVDEIERTFSVEDLQSELYAERWPEIWGPDGWSRNISHGDVRSQLRSSIDFRMSERYGRDWEIDEATVAVARAELETDLDRYLFEGFVRSERHFHEVRQRAVERREQLREEGVIR
ncbi:MAG: hypothetical protein F4107_11905 [Gemmatimonadetes bacterium]|nr:hypothetical protein [Gemmatimonadota bacterium]MYD13211.1 hypothetical protein [Gemmatimonadota bacterium]MYI66617.1 hypothetical protein [Gemmatimonadota bacterium]